MTEIVSDEKVVISTEPTPFGDKIIERKTVHAPLTTLDVGCGDLPRGDVNCDLFVGKTPHLDETRGIINPKKTANFVRCDAHFLPFRDKSFSTVMCRHVLEHKGINPSRVLLEMVRTARCKVVFRVPHYMHHIWNRRKHSPMHARAFSRTNTVQWLNRLNLPLVGPPTIKTSSYVYFPNEIVPLLRWSSEITAVLKLRR